MELLKTYTLPIKDNKVLEIGGGDKPILRPNMDVRAMTTVDIVHNFNDLPLPFASNQFSLIYQGYSLEHISWRKIWDYVTEIHRILLPGGVFCALTANLYAQCKRIVDVGESGFTQDLCTMIFGDQNYDNKEWIYNSHYVGWSPSWLEKKLKECGFNHVKMWAYPIETDMIFEAYKSEAKIIYGG